MMQGPPLRDIHLPPEPGWWPPAPGWWVLAGLLLLVLAWLAALLRRTLRRRRHARELAALAGQAAAQAHGDASGAALAAELSQLLRRAARMVDPAAAALQGEAWLCWLDGDDPGTPFSRGPGRVLLDAPWRRELSRAAVEPLVPLVAARLARAAEQADA